jgi:hypothetical protein
MEIERVYLLYKVDHYYTHDSKELITVCGDMQTINEMITEHAKKENQVITEECLMQIQSIGQTQSNSEIERDFEYLVELSPFDEL